MPTEIHGHEVMHAMMASGRTFTRASLAEFIVAQFGADARFYTCSASGLTARELVDLLAAKGKFTGTESAFTLDPNRQCRH